MQSFSKLLRQFKQFLWQDEQVDGPGFYSKK